jgi:hypothetical protein
MATSWGRVRIEARRRARPIRIQSFQRAREEAPLARKHTGIRARQANATQGILDADAQRRYDES